MIRRKMNLQLFAEAGAGDPGAGQGTPPAGNPPAGGTTFTTDQMAEIDRIANDRSDRASKAAVTSYFQQQGMTAEQVTEAFAAYKDAKAKELPQSAKEAIAAANKQAADALNSANQILIKADARVQAASIGARADRIDTILSMAKLEGVKVTDGNVDSPAVKAALEAILKQFPEWKQEGSSNQPGFQIGGDGNGNSQQEADDAKLRKAFGLPPKK